ncbi:hypothetical protein AOQ84DRAFT_35962 [Glonium stellatum]|uniref:JmjC domain-containing protein n=1 Tax=Glonium stellatum TaxID=574774 RepID=A0A8E2FDW9_9PEZI|nr:hypothetical protein AOQ84DRAFT_35962 [Glonium stellatum]
MANDHFRKRVLAQLEKKIDNRSPTTWGSLNNKVMHRLLSRAIPPVISGSNNGLEAYYLTGQEAENKLDFHATNLHGPIITHHQQQFEWDKRKGRPIGQLFRRMGNLNRTVSVQKPSLSLENDSFITMPLYDVQDKFLTNMVSEDPLNVLDLCNPLPRSILPKFLTGEDCQLLSEVRYSVLGGDTAERCVATAAKWNKWRDDEDWVLVAQGGAQTLTHEDGLGKATWLTVQEGQLGLGWISHPTEEERRDWGASPNTFQGGRLRYVVLHPGQTIYFEAGTIHFVFRAVEYQTAIVGGHILRWSRVVSFMEVVLHQLQFPDATNEEILPSARVYVETVARLISDRKTSGRSEELGGEESIARFFLLKEKFDKILKRRRKRAV